MLCPEEYYDLKVLKNSTRKIDELIRYVANQNQELKRYRVRNRTLPEMFDVTPKLVQDFRRQALSHVRHVLDNLKEYGDLYRIAKENHFNTVEIDLLGFPLVCNRYDVMEKIEEYAQTFYKKGCLEFHITCLYLLYFYALLVNPDLNWTILDYLTQGNRNHQYLTLSKY